MEMESLTDRSVLCEKLNMKLMSRPGSLELIERGVLESGLRNIITSGEVTFRRVSSDESDNSGTSPSMKILKHQEALDEVTARRLSLAAQQQRQMTLNQDSGLSKISEQETQPLKLGNSKVLNTTSGNHQKSLVTGQVSRFKGLIFHNYCPAGSKENQEIREQQQEKFIQLQDNRLAGNFPNYPSQMAPKEKINYQNKCSKCCQTPDRIFSLNDLTVAQLKAECRQRNLTRSGNKSSLIAILTPFQEEILATENACTHVAPQPPVASNQNNNSKLNLNDRSISLPTEYYENMEQEASSKNLVAPLTFNVTCFSGSISNLSFGSYPIMIKDNHSTDSKKIESSDNETKQTGNISKQCPEIVNLQPDSELQHQIAMNPSSVCYSSPIETNSQSNTAIYPQQINPILFYKLPTPSGHEPAFIQTNGLEMIQLVQQELLRNIECQSQMSSDQEPEVAHSTLQHQRYVLVNFLQQLIQKTPAFCGCHQLTSDQQKINHWINTCSSFDYQNQSQECMDNGSTNSSHSFLAYLNQQQCSTNAATEQVLEPYCENDLLNLINEVVTEDEMKTNASNVRAESHQNNLVLQQDIKTPNSPMQTDSQTFNESKSASKSNSSDTSYGGDSKRAAWLQKMSPRLYKATSNCANSDLPFSAFNFEFSGGSLLSVCGSRTSSEGCGSINSSITDAQILSPGTEKVLFSTIFQHTNSGSSMENDIFSSTMNMEDVSNCSS